MQPRENPPFFNKKQQNRALRHIFAIKSTKKHHLTTQTKQYAKHTAHTYKQKKYFAHKVNYTFKNKIIFYIFKNKN